MSNNINYMYILYWQINGYNSSITPLMCQKGTYVVDTELWLSRLLEYQVISDSIGTFYQRNQSIYYLLAINMLN